MQLPTEPDRPPSELAAFFEGILNVIGAIIGLIIALWLLIVLIKFLWARAPQL